jgi:hypothetical protein
MKMFNPLDFTTDLAAELEAWIENYRTKTSWSAPSPHDFQVVKFRVFSVPGVVKDNVSDTSPDPVYKNHNIIFRNRIGD